MRSRLSPLAALLLTVLAMTAFALSFLNLQAALPQHEWRQALWQPDIDNIAQMLFHYSLLPRLAVSLLVGAGLGLVGCCSSRCCATRWRNRPPSGSRPALSWG